MYSTDMEATPSKQFTLVQIRVTFILLAVPVGSVRIAYCRSGGIGRHKGLKIPRGENSVPVQVRPPAKGALNYPSDQLSLCHFRVR